MAEASAFLLPGAPRPIVSPRGVARRCCTRQPSHGLLRWRSPRLPSFVMSSSSSQSSAANPAGDDDDEDDCTDASPPSVDAASASSSDGAPPLPDSEDDDGPPPPLDYSALAARIAALPTADEVVDGGTVHRFDTIEAEDAAGYAAAYRSAVSLYLLLVGDGRSGRGGGGSEGVGGADVYALAVGRDRVALVFATRNDAVLYGRMMLARGGDARHRRVRVAVRCRRVWVGARVALGVWRTGRESVACRWMWGVRVECASTWRCAIVTASDKLRICGAAFVFFLISHLSPIASCFLCTPRSVACRRSCSQTMWSACASLAGCAWGLSPPARCRSPAGTRCRRSARRVGTTETTSSPTEGWTRGRRRRSAKSSTNCLRRAGGVPEAGGHSWL